MKLGIAEILKKADQASTIEEKREIFIRNISQQLIDILRYVFDPKIKFLLPEGAMQYRPNQLLDCENVLYTETRRLYLFVEGGHPTLTQPKRERLFRAVLENVGSDDAELLIHVKDKKLPYPTLTKDVVLRIFPNLLTGG